MALTYEWEGAGEVWEGTGGSRTGRGGYRGGFGGVDPSQYYRVSGEGGRTWGVPAVVVLLALVLFVYWWTAGMVAFFLIWVAVLPVAIALAILRFKHEAAITPPYIFEFFALGCTISIVIATILEVVAQLHSAAIWECHESEYFTWTCDGLFIAIVVVTIGLVEEFSKAIPFFSRIVTEERERPDIGRWWYRVVDTPIGVVLCACSVGAGFAAIENIKYVVSVAQSAGLQEALETSAARSLLAIPFHISCTGMVALSWVQYLFYVPSNWEENSIPESFTTKTFTANLLNCFKSIFIPCQIHQTNQLDQIDHNATTIPAQRIAWARNTSPRNRPRRSSHTVPLLGIKPPTTANPPSTTHGSALLPRSGPKLPGSGPTLPGSGQTLPGSGEAPGEAGPDVVVVSGNDIAGSGDGFTDAAVAFGSEVAPKNTDARRRKAHLDHIPYSTGLSYWNAFRLLLFPTLCHGFYDAGLFLASAFGELVHPEPKLGDQVIGNHLEGATGPLGPRAMTVIRQLSKFARIARTTTGRTGDWDWLLDDGITPLNDKLTEQQQLLYFICGAAGILLGFVAYFITVGRFVVLWRRLTKIDRLALPKTRVYNDVCNFNGVTTADYQAGVESTQ